MGSGVKECGWGSRNGNVLEYFFFLIINRPFPSCLVPLFQSESWCTAFHMKMSFHSHAHRTHFHMKGFARGLMLWKRGTRQFRNSLLHACRAPIMVLFSFFLILILRGHWREKLCTLCGEQHKFFCPFIKATHKNIVIWILACNNRFLIQSTVCH